ncbi:Small ubiquitin-related modifier 3 [Arabidopsis thaliana]
MSNPQEDDKKPIDQEQEAHVILKVKSQDGDEVLFKIKKSTLLKKLMYAYCDRRGLKLDAFAFIFNGLRIGGLETPDEANHSLYHFPFTTYMFLDMEDGDVIDACRAMSGGLRANQRQWSYMLFDHNRL